LGVDSLDDQAVMQWLDLHGSLLSYADPRFSGLFLPELTLSTTSTYSCHGFATMRLP